MKFKIKKEILLEALNKVSKAISTKNLIPILTGIKMELTSKSLTLTASNNDITIQTIINKDDVKEDNFIIEKEGSIVIQGRYILDITKKLNEKFINFEVIDDLKILIHTENSEFNLNGIKESEFPNISLEESKEKIIISGNNIRKIVTQIAFATSTEETKPILTGINFKFDGNILECNATDSYRLARKTITLSKECKSDYNVVIPSQNLIEFSKIINSDDKEIEMNIFSNKIMFKYHNLKFQSRLVNGTYPNTSNLLPKESFLSITVKINNFFGVVDRASILMSDKDKNIVTLETVDNLLYIKSQADEIGRVEEKMVINNNSGKNIKVSFSAKYMMEALRSFSTENVDINFVGDIKPIVLNSKDDESLTQLVLPIRTY